MDWEGSSRLATRWAAGQVYSATSYAPFGEPYNQSGSSDVSFTGQDPDTTGGSPGQDNFLFRRLDPVAGRWTQPDPAGWAAADISNPQTLDRYAYVMNHPLTMVDPLGAGLLHHA